jgi:hypothetical protein
MKYFIYFHIFLLFTIGTIFSIVGILIMLGVSQLISGLFPGAEITSLYLGAKSIISIASGGWVFLQGILINCFSLTMWMLLKLVFRPARPMRPINTSSNVPV